MTTLYKRATPSQARILRAVAGAVKNAADAHPEYQLDEYMARSIAKRACGTITSQWGDLLAATHANGFRPSERAVLTCTRPAQGSAQVCKPNHARAQLDQSESRGPSHSKRRSPLHMLIRDLGMMAGDARRAGQTERLAAIADMLRLIDRLK